MARNVFFSFHYENDIWRASQIRNSWVTKTRTTNGFVDAAAWESVKRKGTASIKNWIDRQMRDTSVTVVLIGAETASRRYVKYEIAQSIAKGNGLLGILIHGMKDPNGDTSERGHNPLDDFKVPNNGFLRSLIPDIPASNKYSTYNWTWDDGYKHFNQWINEAAEKAGR